MSWKINSYGFIEVDVTKEMQDQAEKRNKEFFEQRGHTGTYRLDNARQRITGYLAEMAIKSVFQHFQFSEDSNVDFIYDDKTFDAKAQGCNGPPAPHFVATLYANQAGRNVDYLIFNRVKNDSSKVWITGFIEKAEYLRRARFVEAGTSNNNFTYDQSRYEIEYRQLTRPDQFLLVEASNV